MQDALVGETEWSGRPQGFEVC